MPFHQKFEMMLFYNVGVKIQLSLQVVLHSLSGSCIRNLVVFSRMIGAFNEITGIIQLAYMFWMPTGYSTDLNPLNKQLYVTSLSAPFIAFAGKTEFLMHVRHSEICASASAASDFCPCVYTGLLKSVSCECVYLFGCIKCCMQLVPQSGLGKREGQSTSAGSNCFSHC